MSSVLEDLLAEELVILKVSDVPGLVVESDVLEERELPNALLEVVEVQVDAGSVMVSRV